MNKQTSFLCKFLICFTLIIINNTHVKAQTNTPKPNIIVILADDLGWGDVGFHKSDVKTPNIDQLAKDGMLLSRFYTSPICSPTRAGIMTGRYPDRFGLRKNVIPPWSDFGVPTTEVFLPQFLAKAGYTNRIALGKWHLGHSNKKFLPLSRGFTHFYGHYNGAIDYFTHVREGELDWHNDWKTSSDKGYTTDLLAKEAINTIKKINKEEPFFMYIAFNAPHTPLQAKKEDLLLYGFDENKPKIAQQAGYSSYGRGNTERQTYAAMVSNMDANIGKILRTLDSLQLTQNTLVLFMSDNGANNHGGGSSGALRGHKFQEWEGGVRSPAIMKWPAQLKPGTINNQLMGYVDLVPTLMAVAGVKPTEIQHLPFDGINVLPELLDTRKQISRSLYLGYGSLIYDNWKLITAHAGNAQMKARKNQFFNVVTDPSEKRNIISSNPKKVHILKGLLQKYDSIKPLQTVPPYGKGRATFIAPKEWKILTEE
ncbi:arylsulfatase [Zhouia sp. PK063]|uniref:arylsulfatase n=1 Tax=Zhouia sp. PK063 TaxID=3373602 RepID=UPI0037948767